MKVLIPTQTMCFQVHKSIWYSKPPYSYLEQGCTHVPIYSRFGNLVEIDLGRFLQTKGRKENFVHHTKLLGCNRGIPPMLTNDVMSAWPLYYGVRFRVIPYAPMQNTWYYWDGKPEVDCIGWYAIPGYTIIFDFGRSDWYDGYVQKIYLSFYVLKSDYTTTGNKVCWRNFNFYLNRSGNYSGDRTDTPLCNYLRARIQGISPWRNGQAGRDRNAEACRWMLDKARFVCDDFQTIMSLAIDYIKPMTNYTTSRISSLTPSITDYRTPATLLNEEFLLEEDVISMDHIQRYFFDYGRQHAFLHACESAPELSDNMISNIFEITSFIYNLVVKHEIEIPSSLSDIWLAYRYQYQTTKLDVEEAINFMSRHISAEMWEEGVKSYGECNFMYKGTPMQLRACVKMAKREISQIKNIWLALKKYGLAPDFYAIWDMIPYSFIVDWFIPVGDFLNVTDRSHEYTTTNYDFKKIVYSLTYEIPDENNLVWKVYTRWSEEQPPSLSGFYWLPDNSPSSKTIKMRMIDAAALVLGI